MILDGMHLRHAQLSDCCYVNIADVCTTGCTHNTTFIACMACADVTFGLGVLHLL